MNATCLEGVIRKFSSWDDSIEINSLRDLPVMHRLHIQIMKPRDLFGFIQLANSIKYHSIPDPDNFTVSGSSSKGLYFYHFLLLDKWVLLWLKIQWFRFLQDYSFSWKVILLESWNSLILKSLVLQYYMFLFKGFVIIFLDKNTGIIYYHYHCKA